MWFLVQIYVPLGGAVLIGAIASFTMGRLSTKRPFSRSLQYQVPLYLGRFLYWVGVPGSLIHFLRQADLSGGVLAAPFIAWSVFLLSMGLAWLWIRTQSHGWSDLTKGAFLLSAMLGNTGYIGYPVVLLLPQLGAAYFGWALFYDLLGTVFGSYGLGVVIAAHFGRRGDSKQPFFVSWRRSLFELLKIPTMPA